MDENAKTSAYEKIINWAKSNKLVSIIILSLLAIGTLVTVLNGIFDLGNKICGSDEPEAINSHKSSIDLTETNGQFDYSLIDFDTTIAGHRSSFIKFLVPNDWIELYDHTVLKSSPIFVHPVEPECQILSENTIRCDEDYNKTISCDTLACTSNCWIEQVENERFREYSNLRIIESQEVYVENHEFPDSLSFDLELYSPPFHAIRYVIEYVAEKPMKAIILSKYNMGCGHLLIVSYPQNLADHMDQLASKIIDNVTFKVQLSP